MIPVTASGAVTIRGRSGTLNPYQTSVVVGSPPQWADDSDSTYATAWRSGRTVNETEDAVDIARATFEPLTAIDQSEVVDITLHVRASTSGGAARSISATLSGEMMGFVLAFETTSSLPYWDLIPDGAIHDYISPLTPAVLAYSFASLSDVAYTLTQDTAYVEFARLRSDGAEDVPYDSEITVYKVWLEVNKDVAPPAPYVPPALAHPSLRMLQRGGSGGMSGIPRMVGNPTVRGSLRRGPGSVY